MIWDGFTTMIQNSFYLIILAEFPHAYISDGYSRLSRLFKLGVFDEWSYFSRLAWASKYFTSSPRANFTPFHALHHFLFNAYATGKPRMYPLGSNNLFSAVCDVNLSCVQFKDTLHMMHVMSFFLSRNFAHHWINFLSSLVGYPLSSTNNRIWSSLGFIPFSTASRFHLGAVMLHRFCDLDSSTDWLILSTANKVLRQHPIWKQG